MGSALHSPVNQASQTISLPRLYPAQFRLWSERRRFNIVCCGRRWGKTFMGIERAARWAMKGYPVAWFSPTYSGEAGLADSWRELLRVLEPATRRASAQEHRLELVTGGSIDGWTLEKEGSGRGRKYARVIIDEAAISRNLEENWNNAIRPTLADLGGDAWMFSTPKGLNYFHTLHQRGADPQWPEWASWQMPTSTNPYIKPSEIEAARQDMPSIAFRQEFLAEFVVGAGARIDRAWLKTAPTPPMGALEVVMGVDLAISTKAEADYTACAILGRERVNGGFRYWVLDAQRVRCPFNQVLHFIQRMAAQWSPAQIIIEDVQYQAAVVQELLRTTALPVRGMKPDKDKLTRFQPLEARYEQGMVYHAPGLSREFEDELLSFPLGEHDDLCDALAYAYQALGSSGMGFMDYMRSEAK